jgi:hypothetical protein
MRLVAFALTPILFSGCASTDHYAALREQTLAWREVEMAKAQASAKRFEALALVSRNGDTAAQVAVAMALAGLGGTSGVPASTPPPQITDPNDSALRWASIILPSATAITAGYFGYRLGETQSNNAAAASISANSTMLGMANGTRDVALGGFNTFASLPPATSTTNSFTTSVTGGGQAVVGGSTLTDSRRNCVPTYNQSPGGMASPLPAGATFTNVFNPSQPFAC